MTIMNILDILAVVAWMTFLVSAVVAAVRDTLGYRKPWDFLDWRLNRPVHLLYAYGFSVCGDADKRDPVTRKPQEATCPACSRRNAQNQAERWWPARHETSHNQLTLWQVSQVYCCYCEDAPGCTDGG